MWLDKVMDIMGGNLLGGVKDLIQTFKLPPEQQLQFDSKMAELQSQAETRLAELEQADRNSARQREIGVKDNTPRILAYSITAGFFSVTWFMMTNEAPESSQRILDMLFGTLLTAWVAVITYYFGSSAGSAAKHSMIEKLTGK